MAALRELAARGAVSAIANGSGLVSCSTWGQAVPEPVRRTRSPSVSLRRQPQCLLRRSVSASSDSRDSLESASLSRKELTPGLPTRLRHASGGDGGRRPPSRQRQQWQRGFACVARAASFDYVEFSAALDTNIPLRERPEAPFDRYLENPNRVFKAFFPDTQRSEQLSEDVWRIHMLPITFFLLTARPVVDMRIYLDKPSLQADKIRDASSVKHVMRLQATKWELRGVDYDPSRFSLDVRGSLFAQSASPSQPGTVTSYASNSRQTQTQVQGSGTSFSYSSSSSSGNGATTVISSSSSGRFGSSNSTRSSSSSSSSSMSYGGRRGAARSMLRGRMAVTVGMQVPPNLMLVPRQSIEAVGSAVLQHLLASMKDRVNNRVLDDYAKFAAEHSRSALNK